jgi:hypothetical protein
VRTSKLAPATRRGGSLHFFPSRCFFFGGEPALVLAGSAPTLTIGAAAASGRAGALRFVVVTGGDAARLSGAAAARSLGLGAGAGAGASEVAAARGLF